MTDLKVIKLIFEDRKELQNGVGLGNGFYYSSSYL